MIAWDTLAFHERSVSPLLPPRPPTGTSSHEQSDETNKNDPCTCHAPGFAMNPIVESLLDPHRPTFLFGCVPPGAGTKLQDAEKIASSFADRGRTLAVDG